ncbi:ribosomal-protein-alanine N-acetyltransferase [Marinitenerispora sediminis]|uniref:Ribosomal-protein-alanine N-acetyltransferase n=2 Tax=Marinitenerispora sediminis TaxID=1931232 RepID=A0A368T076_9ACTN|nr:ribosomal protein S18-alanine N-acetyltransferase [Marinitenerispora sediminis]RCV51466.1 ribosomal-protein-alanine N-acetyltransferase [Marinitenerispora sediminis]RCV51909.1 ribosomal-protein-alanine N-acetyltransferase [Marinitenerispora sediminis]RCV55251.1 ribosomal-protein-alanine N-acetyltransferase [Marinitenerispora sediminis]
MAVADLDSVIELEAALFPGDAWSQAMLHDELTASGRHYLVAVEGGDDARVIGYAGLRAVPPEGDVQTIAVGRPWWGRGVGTALLSELLAEAGRRGVREVFLEVRSDNPRAQDLYKRFGFVELGVRRGYYAGADAIVMRRSAPAAQDAAARAPHDPRADEERAP